jgi:hypothetical protein
MGVSSLTELTEELLLEAAVFVAQDQGSPGFLGRFAETVTADPGLASRALERALDARARAGNLSVSLGPGDLRVETTSTGARLTACVLSGPDGGLAASLRLVDAERHPVVGAAVRVQAQGEERVIVTDPGGGVNVSEAGQTLVIQLGSVRGNEEGSGADSANIIDLPRIRRDRYELAAARKDAEQMPDEPMWWRVTAGGVDFLCQERSGGYDLTLLVEGVPADFATRSVGAYEVRFASWSRHGSRQDWIVPLAQRPLGLGGSLYGTDMDRLDKAGVHIGHAEELIDPAEENADEVIRRSVWHSDAASAWIALCQRLEPGRLRTMVEAALTERENAL